ncbi:hypothetical protein BJX68DRAFT_243457 [Aspergillus pseudodeflectus]|uniref:Uncharacterized protein n=1 Tax=Aspergillus pseudodeflectus TaxID=176178 RepID=A0ABR4JVX7_9EURO
MCHKISWYHALCLHSDQASTVHIFCETALHCSYDCDFEESWSLPILGACRLCTVKAAFAENLSLRSELYAVAVSPVVEGAEKVALMGDDALCSFETHSEAAVDELELFDQITF